MKNYEKPDCAVRMFDTEEVAVVSIVERDLMPADIMGGAVEWQQDWNTVSIK